MIKEARNRFTIERYFNIPLFKKTLQHYNLSQNDILGAGEYGIALNYKNRVLKVTIKENELRAVRKLMQINSKYYVKLFNPKRIVDNNTKHEIKSLFVYELEKLSTPSDHEKEIIRELFNIEKEDAINSYPNSRKIIEDFYNGIDELEYDNNIKDLHVENCGFREDGTLVFFDGTINGVKLDGELDRVILESTSPSKVIISESIFNETIFYHGTDKENLEEDIDSEFLFISESKNFAKDYGKYLYQVKVNLGNIFDSLSEKHIRLIYENGFKLYDTYYERQYETVEEVLEESDYAHDSWEMIENTLGLVNWIFRNRFHSIRITEGSEVNYIIKPKDIISISKI